MTLDEMQEKHNRRMKLRARASKHIQGFSLKNTVIYDFEGKKNGRAIKNQGKRRGLTTGHQLKIGRV